ncbi:MAG: ergothioneine biosynthesis protein EgtB [Pseudomonadota bacterium]
MRDLIELGCHHEMQHQELLLTDLLHGLSYNPLLPVYREPSPMPVTSEQPLSFTRHPGGLHHVGHDGFGFAFDCEGPRHRVFLEPFDLADRPVTNRDWIAFMEDGGYQTTALWLMEGWAVCQREGWDAPLYWWRQDDAWWSFTLRGAQPVNLDAPVVHVSYYEADAFARWAGARLPTEAEWEVASSSAPITGNFMESATYRPLPGGRLWGDVWEWTQSPFTPYPGFRASEGAIGEYNGKFMVNQMVLRGGSCATPKLQMRPSYRTFFYPHQRWQMLGLRLARDVAANHLPAPAGGSELERSAIAGLAAKPKRLESKWFYDAAGSELFEQITGLPEYYPTRTEIAILQERLPELTAHLPDGAALVELGSGASVKTRILLDGVPQLAAYIPMDISADFLAETAAQLQGDYPDLAIHPLAGDFMGEIAFPPALSDLKKVAFFPGSTIGNLEQPAASALLAQVRNWPGIQAFILGFDLVKDTDRLIRAYDDSQGITAAFNRNILTRLNAAAGADFDVESFAHEARWNAAARRIEMHLVSQRAQTVKLGTQTFSFAQGESIHTENSHKYTEESIREIAGNADWSVANVLTDPNRDFAVCVLVPA